jgi:RNA polymerase primary sigma factor
MYLKEIGKVPLLTAAQEVDLAMRIESGEFSTALIRSIDLTHKVDQKQFRQVVEAVVRIREHQLNPEKRLKHEGIGRERITRLYKAKNQAECLDFLRRVERDGQLAKEEAHRGEPPTGGLHRQAVRGPGMLFLDLIQEGNLG